MFVQVIEGRVRDRDGLRKQLDRWQEELAPRATGWLGATSGVTEDGSFLGVVRFESEEAAKANSDRPEQSAWWEQAKGNFDGDVTFRDCPVVDVMGGGSDDAGFVQVMQGRADRDEMLAVVSGLEDFFRRIRPDVIGELVAWPGDGSYTEVIYFTSEADARKGEKAELAPEDAEVFARVIAVSAPERFVDLPHPWLFSA